MMTALVKNWKKLLFCYLVLYFAGVVIKIISQYGDFQWDFMTFYYAAKAFLSGLNPYDAGNLSFLIVQCRLSLCLSAIFAMVLRAVYLCKLSCRFLPIRLV